MRGPWSRRARELGPCGLSMKRRAIVRGLMFLFVAMGGCVAGLAFAEESSIAEASYIVSSGAEGGYYHEVASRIAQSLSEEGQTASARASAGSIENLRLLADPSSGVNVALVQADAITHFIDQHAEFAGELVVLDELGPECAALITRSKGGISDAGDLKQGGFGLLAIPSSGSGAAVTYEYMVRMDPAYRRTSVTYRDPIEALLEMRKEEGEPIAAVMLVKRPRTLTPEFEIVVENQDDFKVAPIRPEHVQNGNLPDGSPVYRFERVSTGVARDRHVTYETMCTRGLIVTTSSKLSGLQHEELSRVLGKFRRRIAHGR